MHHMIRHPRRIAARAGMPMLLAALAGCAGSRPAFEAQAAPDADRRAILAMLGDYDVSFDFTETVVLKPGYELRPNKRTGAHEAVILAEDDGARSVIQHVLVSDEGHVTKHWRQDWTWQAAQRFEFTEDQTWRLRKLTREQRRGSWTQCVFEVSDAPRYCGSGRWTHEGQGVSTWTSDQTFRPLPRREYTTRSDYNAVLAINRHTITPVGWTHEQDNTKLIRDGQRITGAVVREFGFNDYRHAATTGDDVVSFKPAHDFWQGTSGYWAQLRVAWDRYLVQGTGVQLKTKVDGMALIMPIFEQADQAQSGQTPTPAEIQAVLDRWAVPPTPEPDRVATTSP